MFVRKQKLKKKSGIKTYYSIVESISSKKYPILKNIKYLGTVERILRVFEFYEKNKNAGGSSNSPAADFRMPGYAGHKRWRYGTRGNGDKAV